MGRALRTLCASTFVPHRAMQRCFLALNNGRNGNKQANITSPIIPCTMITFMPFAAFLATASTSPGGPVLPPWPIWARSSRNSAMPLVTTGTPEETQGDEVKNGIDGPKKKQAQESLRGMTNKPTLRKSSKHLECHAPAASTMSGRYIYDTHRWKQPRPHYPRSIYQVHVS